MRAGRPSPDALAATGVAKRYGEATNVRAFDGEPGELTEMDALVAYLQILGRLTDAAHKPVARGRQTMDTRHARLALEVVRGCST